MKLIPPFDDDDLPGHQREGILAGCFENDSRLGVTSRFREEASSLVRGIEQRYPPTRFSELYQGRTEIPDDSLVIRVLNDVDVHCQETSEYLNRFKTTQEIFRIGSQFGGCRTSTIEIGLAALLIQRAVQQGYLQEKVKLVEGKRVPYLSVANPDLN